MISVLILTQDEEANLPRCLEAVRWSDDIVVVDSGSSDRTVEIARASGASVVHRPFDNERDHRTASLRLKFKYPWVYNPDADEVATPELCEEMREVVRQQERPEVAYRVRFKTMFMGRWIKYSSLYPTWVVRLFQPASISFERTINLRYLINGAEGRLHHHFEHYTFNKGINAWVEKHNRYSTQEARENLEALAAGSVRWGNLLCLDPVQRRRALKELSFRLPCRRTLRFVYMYLLRLGFLDGMAGYHYCRLVAICEYLIVVKMKEIRRRQLGLPL